MITLRGCTPLCSLPNKLISLVNSNYDLRHQKMPPAANPNALMLLTSCEKAYSQPKANPGPLQKDHNTNSSFFFFFHCL